MMKEVEAVKLQCLKEVTLKCEGRGCMAWLIHSTEKPDEGQCMYTCVGTSLMKVLQIWAHMVTQPKSTLVGR